MALNITAGHAIGTEWSLVTISLLFLIGRLYVRGYMQRRFSISDGLTICAWVLFLLGASLDTHLMRLGFHRPNIKYYGQEPNITKMLSLEKVEKIYKILYIEVYLYYSALWSVKLALLTLYHDMIPPLMHGTRMLLYVTGAMVVLGYITLILLYIFSCFPTHRNWDIFNPQDLCLSWSHIYVFLIVLGFHLGTDIMLFAIPFMLLRYLNLPRGKRWGFMAVFALGILCISSTVTRTICIAKLDPRPTVSCIFSALEEGTAIVVVCSPSLRVLVEKGYDRMRTFIYSISGRTDSEASSMEEAATGIISGGGGMFSRKASLAGIGAVQTIGTESKGWRSRMGSGQVGVEGADIGFGGYGGPGGILLTFDIEVEEACVEYHNHRKQSS